MPYDQICLRILISGICIFHLKMRVFWLSGPNGSPDKKLKHEGNVAHRTFRGGCVLHLVLKNDSLYPKIAMFSYKWVTLYMCRNETLLSQHLIKISFLGLAVRTLDTSFHLLSVSQGKKRWKYGTWKIASGFRWFCKRYMNDRRDKVL